MIIFGCLLIGIFGNQVSAVKQRGNQQQQHTIQETSLPQFIPPQRFCGCDELNRCVHDQSTKEHELLTACRRECGARIFLDSTMKKIGGCYDTFDHKKHEACSNHRQCVESMGVRQCISDHHIETPQTFTINTTEFLQAGTKQNANGHRKLILPESVNQLAVCTRTCVQNLGVVNFNPDGSIIKPKTANNGKNKQEKQKNGQENGNGNGNSGKAALCSVLLNCQLSPLDKKLDKQARQLCKFQPGIHQEDNELALCTCLEGALGQNLYCTEQLTPAHACTTPTAQCPYHKNIGNERR